MTGYPCISLTTDYGISDGFVAACHGVIARLAPAVRIIDITHAVPPADVRRGAAVLAQTVPYLPPAVHVAVVDPGVGTARRGVAVRAPGGLLIGPDNGLLPWAATALGGAEAAVELTNPDWFPAVSTTFHGRDVFAPAAARFARGAPLSEAGPAIDPDGLVRLDDPVVSAGPGWLESSVLTVDHFGNVQLAAPAEVLAGLSARVRVSRQPQHAETGQPEHQGEAQHQGEAEHPEERELVAVQATTFGEAPPGGLVLLVDSAGHVALAINRGRAADALGAAAGDVLRIVDEP